MAPPSGGRRGTQPPPHRPSQRLSQRRTPARNAADAHATQPPRATHSEMPPPNRGGAAAPPIRGAGPTRQQITPPDPPTTHPARHAQPLIRRAGDLSPLGGVAFEEVVLFIRMHRVGRVVHMPLTMGRGQAGGASAVTRS